MFYTPVLGRRSGDITRLIGKMRSRMREGSLRAGGVRGDLLRAGHVTNLARRNSLFAFGSDA
jgi:hypothetical protein